MELFDGSGSDNDDLAKIEINEDYARRFEYNKKREELQRYEELKKKGVFSSSSESESESESSDNDEGNEKSIRFRREDKDFFDALIKVKKQDPSLKQKDVKLFESDDSSGEEDNEEEEGNLKEKKGKKLYLKDVTAKHLIEGGPDFEDRVDGVKSYNEEQKEVIEEALEGLNDAWKSVEDEGDFFQVKEKEGEGEVEDDNDEIERKLNEYFGEDRELDENDKFLKEFFMKKMWVDKDKKDKKVGEEELEAISEDESEIERQEEYEYRFQENPGDRVLGHARKMEGSVRKKTNARKEQRKSKEERMAIAAKEREEELKRLKNLKKQEMAEKVKKIMKTAGMREDDIIALSAKEIEEEFDPEEYDMMMKKAFDDNYYNTEDADPVFVNDDDDDIEKPDFEKEDELLGLPKGWDDRGSDDGFAAARARILKKEENSSDWELDDGDKAKIEEENVITELDEGEERKIEEENVSEDGKRKRKHKTALLEKAKQAMMDEYHKLNYEGVIGDIKTRFKYAKTKPNRYGLTTEEIMWVDEKELNQFVSLKKLAPYREKEWKLSNERRSQLKNKTRDILRTGNLDKKKKGKKRSRDDASKSTPSTNAVDDGKAKLEESNGDMGKLSRKARRKLNTKDLKVSHQRLLAYGKITPKSKGQRKH
ncbi:Protein KRI1-like protein [Quillaja saponaria]|uniref:Protein KRI1-like protein n=1 Tax=Quillaja saponaria TaxID=32244 RepID=A0AAD7M5Y2_QUISA|nr:Protein KRI1-like protein [Quillaja saponaria]